MLGTPHMGKLSLWDTSGHSDFYSSSMFSRIKVPRSDPVADGLTSSDGKDSCSEDYQLKPMNCPFHCAVYTARPRSYRDLPLRWAELGTVYRYARYAHLVSWCGLRRIAPVCLYVLLMQIRAFWNALRPATRARVHARRCPHLLHTVAGQGRDFGSASPDAALLIHLWL